MAIIKWDPFREFSRPLMRWNFPVSDWFEDEWTGSMPIDVYEEKDKVIVKADLPGFESEDVEISVTEDAVTIQAEKREEKKEEDKKRKYLRQERRVERCARTLSLPSLVDAEKADADFESGTLTLSLPKVKGEKPKEVKIQVKKKKS